MIIDDLKPLEIDINKPLPDPVNARTGHDLDVIAASLSLYGQRTPIVINRKSNIVLKGNGTLQGAKRLGWQTIAAVFVDDDPTTATGYSLADNRAGELSRWDNEILAQLLSAQDDPADVPGFSQADLDELIAEVGGALDDLMGEEGEIVEDEPQIDKAEELQQTWQVQTGDLWQLGRHRLICGDCTDKAVIDRLMDGERADLVCADPPYGMGKEKDGIANDNLYREKLDAFQMAWWLALRPSVHDNGSAYIWGNTEDLWRLWYVGGLKDSERLTFRNEIVWDKASGQGMLSDAHRMYPTGSERCLFFMLGEQGFNNNADNYWEGWEPIRLYLKGERDKMGWGNKEVAAMFNFHPRMASHWFDESQWSFIREEQYQKLQTAAKGQGFKRDYEELKRDYEELKRDYEELKREFYSTRAYFDNTHDNMTDVWNYQRVTGEDRHGHATPKPVEMIGRIIKSSCPVDGLTVDPFLGSGTTLIASHQLNRICYGSEISPKYCAVILQRYADLTGETPIKL